MNENKFNTWDLLLFLLGGVFFGIAICVIIDSGFGHGEHNSDEGFRFDELSNEVMATSYSVGYQSAIIYCVENNDGALAGDYKPSLEYSLAEYMNNLNAKCNRPNTPGHRGTRHHGKLTCSQPVIDDN